MQKWAWGTTSWLALCGAGWAPCRDSSWPLWEGRSGDFNEGLSESWSLQPGASARMSKGGVLLAARWGSGSWNQHGLKPLAFLNGWGCRVNSCHRHPSASTTSWYPNSLFCTLEPGGDSLFPELRHLCVVHQVSWAPREVGLVQSGML